MLVCIWDSDFILFLLKSEKEFEVWNIVKCDETGHDEIPSIRVKNNLGTVVSKIGYVLNSAEAETLLSATLIHEVCNI